MKRFSTVISLMSLTFSVVACAGAGSTVGDTKEQTDSAIVVAASFYPIAEIVERVGGDNVRVINLTPAGTDAHDVELTAKQLQELQDAKITFYLGDHFQPAINKAIESLKGRSFDLLNVTPAMGFTCGTCEPDPHVWLDPANMILMTKEVTKQLSATRPELADNFANNALAFEKELTSVGNLIDTSFKNCESQALVTSHYSFGYFAKRAQLDLSALAGADHEDELSAKDIEQIIQKLRTQNVTTIFSEELVPSSSVATVAKSLNASVDVLQPLEGTTNSDLEAGKNYISAQRDNITRIAKGLRCS